MLPISNSTLNKASSSLLSSVCVSDIVACQIRYEERGTWVVNVVVLQLPLVQTYMAIEKCYFDPMFTL